MALNVLKVAGAVVKESSTSIDSFGSKTCGRWRWESTRRNGLLGAEGWWKKGGGASKGTYSSCGVTYSAAAADARPLRAW